MGICKGVINDHIAQSNSDRHQGLESSYMYFGLTTDMWSPKSDPPVLPGSTRLASQVE